MPSQPLYGYIRGRGEGGGQKLQNVKDDIDEMAGNDQELHNTRIKKITTPDAF